ncbi:cupin domain-containing protein [Pseudonocardia spinosispora]|uniref:cupin domain-containing protein n=1 Tax=Pseudonocardia spinosispora TaxID=103441 RepID=UPI0003F973BE|nr:cupin domain-containing protein [Pseudonocardia spinosispora]
MTTAAWTHVIADSAASEFVPFEYPEAGGTGRTRTFGEIAVQRSTAYDGTVHVAAFWRVGATTSPLYDVPMGDESGYVVRGRVTIELVDTGETVELNAGDLYSFKKGTMTRWTFHEPFEKFVVVTDGRAG